ncbi:transposase [Rhodococcus tukisamuensis]|uniref:Transposase n=1 Tax=Rhodococcus tukisamuensis TaxID=168276 RepID=A0A1G6MPR2_9NOCA|nr:transposase [Rhodococcus tukisamuensis]
MSSGTSKRYPPELRERAVRMVAEIRPEHSSQWAAIESVAAKLGIGAAQTLHNWIRKAQVDSGQRAGVTTDAADELRKLRAENRELKRANEILKSASTFFAAELDRQRK